MNFPRCDNCGTTKKQLFLLNSFFCPRDCDRRPTGRIFWGVFSDQFKVQGEARCYLFDSPDHARAFLLRHEKNFPKSNRTFVARRVKVLPDESITTTNYYGEQVDEANVQIIPDDSSMTVRISI